jgi:hypothetical protein
MEEPAEAVAEGAMLRVLALGTLITFAVVMVGATVGVMMMVFFI